MIPIKTIRIHHRLYVHRIGNQEFSLPLPQCIDVGISIGPKIQQNVVRRRQPAIHQPIQHYKPCTRVSLQNARKGDKIR